MVKNNAEKQIKQTAIEANGRMETLYKQVDTLSSQLVTNETVQQQLLSMVNGNSLNFSEKQTLARIIGNYQVYSDGIQSFELYSVDGNRIYPFDDTQLSDRIDLKWIEQADSYKGKAVWAGKDPLNGSYSLAIRRVSLMDRWYTKGGYLVTRIYNSYFQVNDIDQGDEHREFMMLLDQSLTPITSNYKGSLKGVLEAGKQSVKIDGTDYMVVKERSELTGWTLVILMPMSRLFEGVSAVRASILLSGGIGWVIFLISSLFLSHFITRPIHKLTSTMKNAKLDKLKQSPKMFSSVEIIELNNTYNQMAENMNHLIQEVYEKELLRSRTELKALQAQINPHFLYNTLNALYWSLEERGVEDLAELVVVMSNLFRYTIGNSREGEWVRIRDELEHIERYLQLMKMRLGDRLMWEVSVDPRHLDCRIPKLIIQPLVENAIVHGIENKTQQGMIAIKTIEAETSGYIRVVVTDNGKGIDQQTLDQINQEVKHDGVSSFKGKGIALSNVNKRLHLYYEKFDLPDLRVESTPGVGTRVTIEIPAKGGS
ncbi:sensor histidine kinase [Paenactinomyces guangxiensis]|nr:sensor histidine kinase [Paenactinomyces guangxiensis]